MLSTTWHRENVRDSRGWVAAMLRGVCGLAERPYAWAVAARNRAYDQRRSPIHRVAAPVISVGNLSVGGTGKTPLVAWLAQWFRDRGVRVALVSRGYGAAAGESNDEARELALRLPDVPHLQNRDRWAAAQAVIVRNNAELILLDDAFQHRRLHRDLDIVLLDGLDPYGGERLLPRGLLREPLESLARAGVVVLTRADFLNRSERDAIRDRVALLAPRALWLEAGLRVDRLLAHGQPPRSTTQLTGLAIGAFCGIGNPDGFRRTLASLGATVAGWREFPDHHRFRARDVDMLDDWAAGLAAAQAIVCTRKDWVKLDRERLGGRPLWALDISLAWHSPTAAFEGLLAALIDRTRE
jgi:tetraacyldisaccharide 4'-kinase